MPIYEYRCTPCEKVFEELIVRKADESEVRCPSCGGKSISRVISATAQPRSGGGASSRSASCGPVG